MIGVVLAGISLGNWLGGWLADRRPGRSILSYQYLASAIAAGLILVLSRDLTSIAAPSSWPAGLQVLWLSTILFFLPAVLLGSVTPMIVKLSLSSLDETGRVVGRIQAAASLGAILGVFLTGFFLISQFGTRAIVADVTVALLALAVASNPFWEELPARAARSAATVGGAAIVVTMLVSGLTLTYKEECTRESNYYCIRVASVEDGQYKQLSLDLLVHGIVSVEDPSLLIYPYERLYGQVVDAKFKDDEPVTAFAIGGGTYTFPRWLERNHDGRTIVAEIDPEVTEIAREEFGLLDTPGLSIIHDDARPVLRDRPDDERYDLVLGDAFGDIAIPYHLVTREFNELVKDHLKANGLYLVNVVDGVKYDFLRSYIKTLMKTFPHVRLVVSPGQAGGGQQNTFVIAASMQPPPQTATMASPEQLAAFLNERDAVTLTDNHVPVDQLLAPVFRQRMHEHVESSEEAGA